MQQRMAEITLSVESGKPEVNQALTRSGCLEGIYRFLELYNNLTWRKITAKGSDLENVSMSASLLRNKLFHFSSS